MAWWGPSSDPRIPSTPPRSQFLVLLPKALTKGFSIIPRVKTHWERKGRKAPNDGVFLVFSHRTHETQ